MVHAEHRVEARLKPWAVRKARGSVRYLIRIDVLLIDSHLCGEGMSLHILRFRDGSHGGSDLRISGIRYDLPSDGLEKLAYPEASGVPSRSTGRQNMVCSDAFITVNNCRVCTEEQRSVVR